MIKYFKTSEVNRFNRACAALALLFLLVTIGGKMLWRFGHSFGAQDFPQYYLAGVVATHHDWGSLYPIPNPASTRNPGFVEDSTMKPGYAALAAERGVGEEVRYMQPPPFALILAPLGLLSFRSAFVIWNLLMTLFAWGICLQAGRIFELCLGRVSRISGLIILLIGTSPLAHRWVRVQNMSAMMGWLIGSAVIGLLQNQTARSSITTWLAGLSKYAGGALIPLYIAMRRWRALIFLIALSAVSFCVSVAIMGWPVFSEFLHVIVPTLSRSNSLTGNQSLQGFLLRVLHVQTLPRGVALGVTIAQLAVLVGLLALLLPRRPAFWKYPPHVFAAGCALVLWMLIFSPMCWDHYIAYVAAFFGWVAWEARQSRGRAAISLAVCVMVYLPTPILDAYFKLPEPLASHLLWGACLMFLLAVWRLADRSEAARKETIAIKTAG